MYDAHAYEPDHDCLVSWIHDWWRRRLTRVRLESEAQRLKLTLNEVSIGFNLTWHSLPALVNLVGAQRAKEMLILGAYNMTDLNEMGISLTWWLMMMP